MSQRIENEQIEADQIFIDGLKKSLQSWLMELEQVQDRICEQAMLDTKKGERSDIYTKLDHREKELETMIAEGQRKLGQVGERYSIGPLSGLLNKVLTQAKPSK